MNPITEIQLFLPAIEAAKGVQILFAIESGSRAWGFESTDSDYDVRYVYIRPVADYLTVSLKRDVIENNDIYQSNPLLDFSGWDFRKFLQLVRKSNPSCFEWMQSTIIYKQDFYWNSVRDAVKPFFCPKAAMHHYLSMARHNYREHMRDGTSPRVKLKKYLYITRPLLCCQWIERNQDAGPPPMPFNDVIQSVNPPSDLTGELLALVERKRAGQELDEGPAIACINRFIDTELWRLRAVADTMPVAHGNTEKLDDLFREMVDLCGP